MCLGVPMKVVEILEPGKRAVAEAQGVKREISTILLTEEAVVGDWVTVHIGYALEVLDVETAEEIMYVLRLSEEIRSLGEEKR